MTQPQVVAVTGGTGFIGSILIKDLLATGHQVRLLARNPNKISQLPNLEVIHGDLSNPAALQLLVQGSAYIVHCAGRVRGRNYAEFKSDNVDGTQNLLQSLAQHAPCAHLLHISSLSACQPFLSDYAQSKKAAEDLVTDCARWTILRPPAVYGPTDAELKPLFDSLRNGISWVPGATSNRFSLLHVEDLSQLLLHIMNNPEPHQQVIYEPDDGSPQGYDWQDLQTISAAVFQRKIRCITIPKVFLKSTAHINMLFSTLIRKAPMLTTGKVNELTFNNWVVDPNKKVPDWQASIQFSEGLKNLYSS